jgi:hypothetical protein
MITGINFTLLAQPSFFSWQRPQDGDNRGNNYISPKKDQGEQSPCHIFAAVAAVEAMSHIYFNKPFSIGSNGIDLAEREIYSWCSGYGGPQGSANIEESLKYIDTTGIINENCFSYPNDTPFYTDCSTMCSNPDFEVNIPGYSEIQISSNENLKKAIIDYGPIAVTLMYVGYELHGAINDNTHSVLIIGWNDSGQWHIKDSWPGNPSIAYKTINVFNPEFDAKFYKVNYEENGNTISCSGSGCSPVFSSRSCTDDDEDGFYNWGIGPKPTGCPGPCKMDFNDADSTTIFLDNDYNLVSTPYVSGLDLICSSDGTFVLNNLPSGFSVSWSLSHPSLFSTPTSGNDTSATIYPKSQYSGDECSITFTISDGCGSAQYTKNFIINGPADSEIDINVVPSKAPTPVRVSGIWLLCPNSTYYIYCENSSDCSTSNYQWTIPSGWTKYEQTSNYIRINTNSTPFGTVEVEATTCCGTDHLVITQNFSQGGACSYFSVYPNPATTEFKIEFEETFDLKTVDESTSLEIYDSGFSKSYKAEKIEKQIKIQTAEWKRGIYYIVLTHKGQKYYEKVTVEK